jgi:hypothetical protein
VPVTAATNTPNVDASLLGGVIAGKVTAAGSAEGVAGIYVCAYEGQGYLYGGCARTNAAGEYRIPGLASGSYVVEFNAASADSERGLNYLTQYYDGAAQQGEATEVPAHADTVTSAIDATLAAGAEIGGNVRSHLTHAGLVGVSVCPLGSGGERLGDCTISGAGGAYLLTGLPTGTYWLQYSLEGYATAYWQDVEEASAATPIPAVAGATVTAVEEDLKPLGSIAGKVTDAASNAALAGIEVCAEVAGGYFTRCATTNAVGEYVLQGLQSGE